MQRELTYHVPFERLVKLSRSTGRRLYPHIRWLVWLMIAIMAGVGTFLYAFGDEIRDVAEDEGIPFASGLGFIVVLLVVIFGLRFVVRYALRVLVCADSFRLVCR